jgi:hypothetical protein
MEKCFGKFGEFDKCFDCEVQLLCSAYLVVDMNKDQCPKYGRGYSSKNEICKLCKEYLVGEECALLSKESRGRKEDV